MARKRYTAEQIIGHLRQAEIRRLKRLVADQALDISILKEVSTGGF